MYILDCVLGERFVVPLVLLSDGDKIRGNCEKWDAYLSGNPHPVIVIEVCGGGSCRQSFSSRSEHVLKSSWSISVTLIIYIVTFYYGIQNDRWDGLDFCGETLYFSVPWLSFGELHLLTTLSSKL